MTGFLYVFEKREMDRQINNAPSFIKKIIKNKENASLKIIILKKSYTPPMLSIRSYIYNNPYTPNHNIGKNIGEYYAKYNLKVLLVT